MDFKSFVFYFFAAILVFAALRVITARNPVHAVLYLVLSFVSAGGVWMLLEAEFLAITLVLVYVGAVMVLFLFVVMMLEINLEKIRENFWRYLPVGAFVALVMVAEMAVILNAPYFSQEAMPAPPAADAAASNTHQIGQVLYTDFVYPFELASLLLLIAMIAAVTLTLRKRKGLKAIDPARQIAVNHRDRVRLVSMPSEEK